MISQSSLLHVYLPFLLFSIFIYTSSCCICCSMTCFCYSALILRFTYNRYLIRVNILQIHSISVYIYIIPVNILLKSVAFYTVMRCSIHSLKSYTPMIINGKNIYIHIHTSLPLSVDTRGFCFPASANCDIGDCLCL